MQRHKKLSARILSTALSVAMVATMMPTTVFAAEGDVPLGASSLGASSIGTIQSFDKLEDRFEPSTGESASKDVYALNVELDTPFEDLNLPDELTGVVARTTTVSAPAEDDPVVDSGKPDEPAEDETIPDEDEPAKDDTATDDTVSDNQPASPSDAEEEVKAEIKDEDVPLAPEPEDKETTVTTVENESIPVEWNSGKEYKSDENGKFVYTAVLPEGYILAGGVKLPQIYVLVGRQARAGTVRDVATAADLKSAFASVNNGETIRLTADITSSDYFTVSGTKSIKLDLNGKILNATASSYFSNYIKLEDSAGIEIIGTAENSIIKTSTYNSLITNGGTGKITVSSGTIISDKLDSYVIENDSTGQVLINGGTVSATGDSKNAVYNSDTGRVFINSGTVSATNASATAIFNASGSFRLMSQ